MATTKSTTPRSRTTKARTSRPENTSLAARTGRTIKERPYTSAAIATGAVTAVAAAAAGAYFFSRRDKSFKEASEELTSRVKDGLASATDKVKGLSQRGSEYLNREKGETRSQSEIAEEALTLKQTGVAKGPMDEMSATQIKTGAVAY